MTRSDRVPCLSAPASRAPEAERATAWSAPFEPVDHGRPAPTRATRVGTVLACAIAIACGSDSPLDESGNPPPPPPPPPPGTWEHRAPMPTSRAEVAGAALDGRIYVVGGLTTLTDALATVEVYDPPSDTWTAAPDMPVQRHHPGLVALGGRLYLTGGYPAGEFPWAASDRVFAFDPAAAEWVERAPMPRPRAAHTSAVVDGRIYVIGGVSDGVTATVDAYDPATDTWEERAPMPTAREHLASAVIDGVIYVVGGRSNINHNVLEAYTPATDSWAALATMPTARSGLGAAALAGRVYVFGGELPGVFNETEEYDPNAPGWRPMADMPTARHGIAAVAVGDRIYVIAGGPQAGASHSTANEAFRP